MSIKYVVLGLLAEAPRHGYAVRAAIEERVGTLVELGAVRVYEILARLEAQGLAARREERIGRRRRKVYAITARGRDELLAWAQGPPTCPGWADVSVRLLAVGADPEAMRALVVAWDRHEHGIIEHWTRRRRIPRDGDAAGLGRWLAIEAEIDRARAVRRALARCREALDGYESGTPVAEVLRSLDLRREPRSDEPEGGGAQCNAPGWRNAKRGISARNTRPPASCIS